MRGHAGSGAELSSSHGQRELAPLLATSVATSKRTWLLTSLVSVAIACGGGSGGLWAATATGCPAVLKAELREDPGTSRALSGLSLSSRLELELCRPH